MTRFFEGAFLIVFKSAVYNEQIQMSYDGRHAVINTDDFREYMEILQSIFTHPILNQYFQALANRDPFKDNYLEELKGMLLMSEEELKEVLPEI